MNRQPAFAKVVRLFARLDEPVAVFGSEFDPVLNDSQRFELQVTHAFQRLVHPHHPRPATPRGSGLVQLGPGTARGPTPAVPGRKQESLITLSGNEAER